MFEKPSAFLRKVTKSAQIGKAKGKGPVAFAKGGIVSSPTLGLVGEYSGARANPEVIAPLDKLKSIHPELFDQNEDKINLT